MNRKSLPPFFTVKQVSEMLVVSPRTVRRWISVDKLGAHKFGRQVRISEFDLRAFLALHKRDVLSCH